jgi:hypothetical protein
MLTKEIEEVEAETLLGRLAKKRTPRQRFSSPLHCLSYASLILNFAFLICYALGRVTLAAPQQNSYESGFRTDMSEIGHDDIWHDFGD